MLAPVVLRAHRLEGGFESRVVAVRCSEDGHAESRVAELRGDAPELVALAVGSGEGNRGSSAVGSAGRGIDHGLPQTLGTDRGDAVCSTRARPQPTEGGDPRARRASVPRELGSGGTSAIDHREPLRDRRVKLPPLLVVRDADELRTAAMDELNAARSSLRPRLAGQPSVMQSVVSVFEHAREITERHEAILGASSR